MNRAPTPATKEPDMMDAALALTPAGAEVLAGPPAAVETLLEGAPTGGETPVAVALLPAGEPAPLPWDGERGVPDETTEPPEMAVEREDEALEAALEADDPVADEDALLEVEVEMLEQDRSYRGVVLNGLPTSPKDGLGVAPWVSSSVYHHMLTFPSLGQATACQ